MSPASRSASSASSTSPASRWATLPDVLRVHGFVALAPGPRLMVLGGVHGNETCGSVAIERVVAQFDTGELSLLRGQLTLLPVANPLARRRLAREGERNLNRLFRPTPAGQTPADYEARITDLLCPLLDRHEVLLDLHSFQSAGEAFAMIGPRDNTGHLEPFARAREEGLLALHLSTPRVVEGWLDIYAAGLAQRARTGIAVQEDAIDFGRGTNEYMRSRGGYGVTLECGQHDDPAAPEVAYQAILATLRLLEMLPPDPAAKAPAHPQLLRLASVTDRLHADDQFVRDWATFDALAQGEPIGQRADGSLVCAEADGYIVFPNEEALPGSEWFYFARESERKLA